MIGLRLRGGGDGEPSDYMKKQKEKQEESGTCVAIITGGDSSSGKARARVGEVCGRTAIGEYEGNKYCGRHLRNLRDNSAEVAACKVEAAAKAVAKAEAKVAEAKAAKEKAAAKAEAKAAKAEDEGKFCEGICSQLERKGKVCGKTAKHEFMGKHYCKSHYNVETKKCRHPTVSDDKRLKKKKGDICGNPGKFEFNGKWYCGHHIHIAKGESHDEAMAEAMAEMKVESEGEGEEESEGEDEGEPFVPFAHDLD